MGEMFVEHDASGSERILRRVNEMVKLDVSDEEVVEGLCNTVEELT